MTVNIVMYFPKNSYLRETFDRTLSQLTTAGIVNYWVKTFADTKYLQVKNDKKGPNKLRVEQLSGVINLWLIGCAVAFFFFLVEIFSATIKRALRIK